MTSTILNKIWMLFVIITFSFILFVAFLLKGFEIGDLKIENIKFEKLYIKLDKKLILRADSIILPQSDKKLSKNEIANKLENLEFIPFLFQEIEIKNINIENNNIKINYIDGKFAIATQLGYADFVVETQKSKVYLKIKELYLKDFDFVLKDGFLKYDIFDEKAFFEGFYLFKGLNGKIIVNKIDNLLNYELNVQKTDSIEKVMEFIKEKTGMEDEIYNWIVKYIRAKSYIIENLKGEFDIQTLDYFPKKIEATGYAKDVVVDFRDGVKPATVKDLKVTLKNDILSFELTKPIYEKIALDGSVVNIYNLLSEGAYIEIDIIANSILDKRILSILQAYKINIPVIQENGNTEAKLKLKVTFKGLETEAFGEFKIYDSNLTISGIDFYSKEGNIKLNNSIIELENANLRYKDLFDVDIDAIIDARGEKIDGIGKFNLISLKFDQNNLYENIRNENNNIDVNFSIDFQDSFNVVLKELETQLDFGKNISKISINDLSKLYEKSKILQTYGIKSGNLTLQTSDFEKYFINLNANELQTPFYLKDENINKAILDIEIDKNNYTIKDNEEKFSIFASGDKMDIFLDGLDIDLEQIQNSEQNNSKKNINITTIKSNILMKNNKKLLCDQMKGNVYNKNKFFEINYGNGLLNFTDNNGTKNILGKNLDNKFISNAIGIDFLSGGIFDLNATGERSLYKGEIFIEDFRIKDITLVNNIFALINTVPSLVFFQDPTFSADGFKAKEAKINFLLQNNILYFEKILIKGYSSDIYAKGFIDLHSKKIDLDVSISSLKNIGNIIKNIPIAGFIILGEDGTIATNIKVTGNMDNPQTKILLLEDTVTTPFGILKRTIQTPLKILE